MHEELDPNKKVKSTEKEIQVFVKGVIYGNRTNLPIL